MNAVDQDGWTVLMRAAWKSHSEIVRMLLTLEADVKAEKRRG